MEQHVYHYNNRGEDITSLAQLYEICTQLLIAIETEAGTDPDAANFEAALLSNYAVLASLGSDTNSDPAEPILGMFECLCESWLPGVFPDVEGPFPCKVYNLTYHHQVQ